MWFKGSRMWRGVVRQIIWDTHIPLFWANAPSRLSAGGAAALEKGRQEGQLAIADISLLFSHAAPCFSRAIQLIA